MSQKDGWDASVVELGTRAGIFKDQGLDVELLFRFIRDTVWVAVHWYRPGGELSAEQVADQYLTVLLEGITPRA